ncbi:MAG TPA: hypothetical protein VF192_01050 [Longimicrobiales bacterium]
MTGVASREQAHAWDLRGAWAGRRAVVVRLDPDRAAIGRLAGYVEHVAPSGAFAVIADLDAGEVHFPCALVLSVRRPHFHEPADRRLRETPPPEGPRRDAPVSGQLCFEFEPEQGVLPL